VHRKILIIDQINRRRENLAERKRSHGGLVGGKGSGELGSEFTLLDESVFGG
jgi:hypothetical protein